MPVNWELLLESRQKGGWKGLKEAISDLQSLINDIGDWILGSGMIEEMKARGIKNFPEALRETGHFLQYAAEYLRVIEELQKKEVNPQVIDFMAKCLWTTLAKVVGTPPTIPYWNLKDYAEKLIEADVVSVEDIEKASEKARNFLLNIEPADLFKLVEVAKFVCLADAFMKNVITAEELKKISENLEYYEETAKEVMQKIDKSLGMEALKSIELLKIMLK